MSSTEDNEKTPETVVGFHPNGFLAVSDTSSSSARREARKRQGSAQGSVTKQISSLKRLMRHDDNLHYVKSGKEELRYRFDLFRDAYIEHLSKVPLESDKKVITQAFDSKMTEFGLFTGELNAWIDDKEHAIQESLKSVSEASSTATSRSRRHSSVTSSRSSGKRSSTSLKVRMQTAVLEAEKAALEQTLAVEATFESKKREMERRKSELEYERIEMERKKRELEQQQKSYQKLNAINVEIAKSKAAESVLNDSLSRSSVYVKPLAKSCVRDAYVPHSDDGGVKLNSSSAKARVPATTTPSVSHAVNLPGVHGPTVASPAIVGGGGDMTHLVSSMRLPRLNPVTFDGDPQSYLTFEIVFDTQIVPFTTSDSERLLYLNSFLKSDAKELIAGCIFMPPEEGYMEARRLLKKEFGDPYKIASSFLNCLYAWSLIKADDVDGIKRFSAFLIKCRQAMAKVSELQVLNHTPNLQEVVHKLPQYLQNKWRDNVSKLRKSRVVGFADLCNFVKDASDVANDPIFSRNAMSKMTKEAKAAIPVVKSKTFVTDVKSTSHIPDRDEKTASKTACPYCLSSHDLDDCADFCKLSVVEKKTFLRSKWTCYDCFTPGHTARGCIQKRKCKVCNDKHPTSMHPDGSENTDVKTNSQSSANRPRPADRVQSSACQSIQSNDQNVVVLHQVLPVRVRQRGCDNSIVTYAFYDNGSSGCFLTSALRDELQATSNDVTLELRTMHGRSQVKSSSVSDLVVTDLEENNAVTIPKAFTRREIPLEHCQIPRPGVLSKHFPSITDELPEYMPDIAIGLLIGSNCPAAHEPIKVVSGTESGTFAVLLRHGWTVNGPVESSTSADGFHVASCNRIHVTEVSHVKEVFVPGTDAILSSFERDFDGCCVGKMPSERGPSREDLLFVNRVDNSVRQVNGHYEIPLPFRDENPVMPNNRIQAVDRAKAQRRKMLKNTTYYDDYCAFMDNLLEKGYAEKIPSDELRKVSGSLWYLPHHGVYHSQKRKIRVVFDCAAKFGGVSLNDQLLQGPDLTNSIVGVLLRFRLGRVAFIGDVETMFYQVRVPDVDRNYLRFVWWPNGDLDSELEDYRMKVHLFGAASSPSVSNFALKKTAEDSCPDVASTIHRNFYVDDCLKAVDTVDVGIQLVKDLRETCAGGGFRLTKFISNCPELLESIPVEERAKDVQNLKLDCDSLPDERALGVQWKISTDQFGFCLTPKQTLMTRRSILSVVASIYDPLGFLAPLILPAKQILQDLCKVEKLDWDQEIPIDAQVRWKRWLTDLPKIEEFAVGRNVTPDWFGEVISRQLHVFSDASNVGYGSCVYLRLRDCHNNVYCCILVGKARVSPVRMVTIPRMELTAAAVSVQLGQLVINELDMDLDSVTYHTDSTTVLYYINNRSKRFPVFVANRVQQILDYSKPSQWKYVGTEQNPADCASRGLDVQHFLKCETWLNGPSFLLISECFEPQPIAFSTPAIEHDPGNQSCIDVNAAAVEETRGLQKLIDYYSSWSALKKAVAVFRRVQKLLLQRCRGHPHQSDANWLSSSFSLDDLEDAESRILKFVQASHFQPDYNVMCEQKPLGKNARLMPLDPFMEDGLVRVGGRLRRSTLNDRQRHPVILPRNSHVTRLIIRECHTRLGHAGRNHVLSSLRESYWIIAGNAAVRQVISSCVVCRRLRGQMCNQQMANLPPERMSTEPPFTYTGTDLFGPFEVKNARKIEKRYGVIFTCLSSRCVHLEIVRSLETDSYINALRRFVARRGPVNTIFSDNGTNLVGADRELRAALKTMDSDRIQMYLSDHKVEWKFNPPAASHMGGIWERQIRSVRKVLVSLLCDNAATRIDDDSLLTLFCEVENIVNSRPITTVSGDPNDLEALTPNHILLMKSKVLLPPPGIFQSADVYMRKRWRRVQYLANVFWTRWKREYLMNLQTRTKWTRPKRNMRAGDVVLVQDDSAHRNVWPLARVCEVTVSSDNHVRSCLVKTATSTLRRPIHKLVLLVPCEE